MASKSQKGSCPSCHECKRRCTTASVNCVGCRKSFHIWCQSLSIRAYELLLNIGEPFLCKSCMKIDVGTTYSFTYALTRLAQASYQSLEHLEYTALRESILLEEMCPISVPTEYAEVSDREVDIIAKRIVERCSLSAYGIPRATLGDGNCLFHAVSLALRGNTSFSSELRVRTCIEMATNAERYLNDPLFEPLSMGVPDYKGFSQAVSDCAVAGHHSSIYTMWALAEVIGTPIHSLYPSLNGPQDRYHQKLTCLLYPSKPSGNNPIHILWCGGLLCSRMSWSPDHFVPLLRYQPTLDMSVFEPLQENCSTPIEPENPFQRQIGLSSPVVVLDQSKHISLNDDQPCLAEQQPVHNDLTYTVLPAAGPELQDTFPYVSTLDEGTIPYAIDRASHSTELERSEFLDRISYQDSRQQREIFRPVPHGGLNARDAYNILTGQEETIHPSVPNGRKENVYMLIDNSKNKQNTTEQRRRVFFDDCGVWNASRRITTRDYIVSQNMRCVTLRDGRYSVEKMIRGVKQWIPLTPQPDQADVVRLHRYYTTLKEDKSYKRTVLWFSSTSNPDIEDAAIYQYEGTFPGESERPHANARENGRPYKRTNPKILEKIRSQPQEKKPKKIYTDLVLDDSMNAPRDTKLIRNARHVQKVKESGQTKGNVADEILHLISTIHEHPYVQKIEHTKNNVPAIILYTEDQLTDFKFFIQSQSEYRVGIDRTFNLGPYFVTCVVYKNIRVVRNETRDHPLFLGPVLLHKEATFETYHYFFSHIKAKLCVNFDKIDLALPTLFEFGSDDEKALVKALDSCFPDAQRALCTKHLKDNVASYLRDKAGASKQERVVISGLIFGDRGLVNAEDTYEFERRSVQIQRAARDHRVFLKYFEKTLKDRLQQYVCEPRRKTGLDRTLWTNNNAESMNHILKVDANWQPKGITDLVDLLHREVTLQLTDLRRSLHGEGNYRLTARFQKYAVKKSIMVTKSREERLEYFRKFLRDNKNASKPNHILSKDGKLRISSKLQKTAKKPGQRQRLKSHRTQKRH